MEANLAANLGEHENIKCCNHPRPAKMAMSVTLPARAAQAKSGQRNGTRMAREGGVHPDWGGRMDLPEFDGAGWDADRSCRPGELESWRPGGP